MINPFRGACVVAPYVPPALALGMRSAAVQFDDHSVFLVTNVFVPGYPAGQRPALPYPVRQAMRPLHAVEVTVLQDGLHARSGVAKRCEQHLPSANSRPGLHGCPQPVRCGAATGAGAEDPGCRPGWRCLRRGEIENCFLQARPRRLEHGMARDVDPLRVMDHDPLHRGGRATAPDHNVNGTAFPGIEQPVQFGRGLVRQHRARPDAQDRGPHHGLAGRPAAICRVYANMEPLPPSAVEPGLDRMTGHSAGQRLGAGDHPGLPAEQVADLFWQLPRHVTRVPAARPVPTA